MLACGASNRFHVSRVLKLFFSTLYWNTILLEYMYERLILKDFPLIVLQL